MAEFIIGRVIGDVFAAGLLHFGLDEDGDDFLFNRVISLKTKGFL